jgi:DNA-binding transcriptional ArsR family regulator
MQLRALVEPRRRQILELVRDREMAAGEIATHFEVTRPAISQHLTVLKDAGLLAERREGARRLYIVRAEGLVALRQFIDGFWSTSLEALKRAAEDEAKAGPGGASSAPGSCNRFTSQHHRRPCSSSSRTP